MSEKKDYYEILGLSKDASADQIMNAYRALAMKYHPDRNKAFGAEEKMKEINEAYDTLSDDEKRAAYLLKNGFGKNWQYSWQYKQEDKVTSSWTASQDEFLYRNFLNMNDIDLAAKLGKPRSKIKQRRGYMGLIRPIVVERSSIEPRVQRIVLELRKGQKIFCEVSVSGGNNDIYFGAFNYKGSVNLLRPEFQETISNLKSFGYKIKNSGHYCFYFSNSFSMVTSKNVKFTYQVETGRKITLSFNI